jgi:aromatic-L-amino-acid decarboxylase
MSANSFATDPARAGDGRDAADSGRIGEALELLAPALERFNRFEGPDPTLGQRGRWLAELDGGLPVEGAGLDAVLRTLAEAVVPHGLRMGAPGFCGWITGQPTTSATVAALVQSLTGPQRVFIHPVNALEAIALRWLAELLGVPNMRGVFTGGGSVASLICLGAARQRAFERLGIDSASTGIPDGQGARIYASSEVHHVVTRAAAVLGLGRRSVVAVDCDERQRIDTRALRSALAAGERDGAVPIAIVATAGTVNTGAVDPIADMAEIAAEREVWLHVDGAYGLFALLDEASAPLFAGLERADSVAIDPHKWMATTVGCGAALVRDLDVLERSFTLEPAAYLEGGAIDVDDLLRSPWDSFGGEYHHLSVEQSAPPRGIQVWAILREIGVEGLRERVRRHLGFARRLAERVAAEEELELLAEPTLSICCFRYRAVGRGEEGLDSLNRELVRRLHCDTRFIPSTTRVGGRLAIRPCYINPRTTEADVDGLADAVPDLTFRPSRAASTGLDDVSVAASDRVWAAAVRARPGACFYLRLDVGGDARYGSGTECTGAAALLASEPRW